MAEDFGSAMMSEQPPEAIYEAMLVIGDLEQRVRRLRAVARAAHGLIRGGQRMDEAHVDEAGKNLAEQLAKLEEGDLD